MRSTFAAARLRRPTFACDRERRMNERKVDDPRGVRDSSLAAVIEVTLDVPQESSEDV